MSQLWLRDIEGQEPAPLRRSGPPPAPLHELQIEMGLSSGDADGGPGREVRGPRRREDEADDWFRADAAAQGYLEADPHPPGGGRGLWAYYRDHGIVPPEVLDRVIPKTEITGTELEREADL